MVKKIQKALFSTLLSGVGLLYAQESLTLEQAIEIAMENNYAIRIAKTEAEIGENNASLGNAGFLPQITANAGQSKSISKSYQEFVSGNVIDRSNAETTSRNVGVALNWTLFDGFSMFASYQRLRQFRKMGEINTRLAIENTLAQVIEAYFDVVQQRQKLQSLQEAMAISQQRLKIAEAKYGIGSESRLDVQNARVDLNEDRSALLRQEISLANAKTTLNQQLARDTALDFVASDTIQIRSNLDIGQLKSLLTRQNSALLLAQKGQTVAKLDVRNAWEPRFPKIGLNVGYSLSRSESQSGFVKSSENQGFTYGLTASYTLFDGFNNNRRLQNAELALRSSELALKETQSEVEAELSRAFQNYNTNVKLTFLEHENVAVAKENVQVSLEKYRLGTLTAIELREVQRKYLDALERLISAQFQAKAAETELLKMTGGLVGSKE